MAIDTGGNHRQLFGMAEKAEGRSRPDIRLRPRQAHHTAEAGRPDGGSCPDRPWQIQCNGIYG